MGRSMFSNGFHGPEGRCVISVLLIQFGVDGRSIAWGFGLFSGLTFICVTLTDISGV